jgi:phosphate-selective porin OprO and OprP
VIIKYHNSILSGRGLARLSGLLPLICLAFIGRLHALEPVDAGLPSILPEELIAAADLQEDSHTRELLQLPHKGPRIYWDHGWRIVDDQQRWQLKIAGKLIVDGGDIHTHDDKTTAFPEMAGSNAQFRRLTVSVAGDLGQRISFSGEIDFAQIQDVMDNWIRFNDIPLLGQLTVGHQREPYSLDTLTSIHSRTFVEQSLPGDAMSPVRNIGALANSSFLGDRMTWAFGGFLNTGSFQDVREARNQIKDSNGYNLTGRLTGLPWYENRGDSLLHLGLSLSHQNRTTDDDERGIRYRARPETRLTDERLVDTGELSARHNNMVDAEMALVWKNLSFQGELFHSFLDASDLQDPWFWGFYLYGSYFLTGERRNYDTSKGIFSRISPRHPFSFKDPDWGAWELALRYSHVDLNDGNTKGGIESN